MRGSEIQWKRTFSAIAFLTLVCSICAAPTLINIPDNRHSIKDIGFASQVERRAWKQSVQGAVATWSVISMRYFKVSDCLKFSEAFAGLC